VVAHNYFIAAGDPLLFVIYGGDGNGKSGKGEFLYYTTFSPYIS
jgi:hypothetical protein